MREIEFRAWHVDHKLMVYFDWAKVAKDQHQMQHLCDLLAGNHSDGTAMQYTGLKDKSGNKIFEGDILNICFTSGLSGEYLHDAIYTVGRSALGSLEFNYKCLLWESHGYNQPPTSSTLCEKYGSLSTVCDDGMHLIKPDLYASNVAKDRDFPFNNHKVLSFNSRYFEVIGNIHESPELLN